MEINQPCKKRRVSQATGKSHGRNHEGARHYHSFEQLQGDPRS
jgi:hypothetical protein